MSMINAALAYQTKLKWAVIPLREKEKIPLIANWPNEASTDPQRASEWFTKYKTANIGIATGEKSGIMVIDVDPKNGGEIGFEELEATLGKLPDTPMQITGSGGRHYIFKYDPELKISNSSNAIAAGVDIKTNGGQIVVAPSIHPNGNKYEWELSSKPNEVPIAELPQAWKDYISKGNNQAKTGPRLHIGEVIPDGARNATLYKAACSMREKGFSDSVIISAISEMNLTQCTIPLPDDEVQTIIKSALKHESGKLQITSATTEVKEAWPEPEPIESELLPVVAMPAEIIPEPFKAWLEDISYRMQCPVDFVVTGAMVMVAAIVGAGCAIKPKARDDWEVIPNLWGGIVARPSMLKSPALAEILKPLAQMEIECKTLYDEEMNLYEVEQEAFKAEKEAIKNQMVAAAKGKSEIKMEDLKFKMMQATEPKQPLRRRFKTNDTTIEKLGELLNENPRGLLVFRDELVGLLCSWEREDRQQDRTFYLEGWNGNQGFTVDRIGRGTIDTANICISILGGIQPSKLTGYLIQSTANLANDGMIQRFQLLVYPDEPKTWELIDLYPNKEAKTKAYEVIKKLTRLDFIKAGAVEDDRPYFHFAEDAQEIFYEWLTDLESKIKFEDNPLVGEHLAKYRSLMPSLALLIHLIDIAHNDSTGAVSSQATIKAAAWCEYLESHARRIYGLLGDVRKRSATELVKKIMQGVVKNGFTKRDVYRNEWHLLNKDQTTEACQKLVEAGWLKVTTVETEGKSREEFIINPKIKIPPKAQHED